MIVSTTEQEPRSLSVLLIVLGVVVGGGMLVAGVCRLLGDVRLLQTGLRTTGVVMANERYDSVRGGPTYYPMVRFMARGGQTYRLRGADGDDPPQFRVGDKVTIYYDPHHPQMALIDSDRLWQFPLECFLFGPLFLLGGAWLGRACSPQARRRRMLNLLHGLGGAALVWDARDGTLEIAGLHLQDTAGSRVPFRSVTRYAYDSAHEAEKIAQHYSTEPGHYVLALPEGTVISTPRVGLSHRPAARLEPTPPQAPLPAQPERTPSRLGQAALVLVQPFLLVAIAVVVVAAITVVVVTIAQQML